MENLIKMQKAIELFFATKAMRLISSTALAFYQDSWRRKGWIQSGYKQWKPRNSKAVRHEGRALMIDSGALRRSITYRIVGDSIEIRSDRDYAKMHNEGLIATITVPMHTRTSKKGKAFTVKAYSKRIQIPQRQFMDFGDNMSPFLVKRIEMIVEKKLDAIIKQFV